MSVPLLARLWPSGLPALTPQDVHDLRRGATTRPVVPDPVLLHAASGVLVGLR